MKKYVILSVLALAACQKSDVKPQKIDQLRLSMSTPQEIRQATPEEIITALQGTWLMDSSTTHFITLDGVDSATVGFMQSSDVGDEYIINGDSVTLVLPAGNGRSEPYVSGHAKINISDDTVNMNWGWTEGTFLLKSIQDSSFAITPAHYAATSPYYYTLQWMYWTKQ